MIEWMFGAVSLGAWVHGDTWGYTYADTAEVFQRLSEGKEREKDAQGWGVADGDEGGTREGVGAKGDDRG